MRAIAGLTCSRPLAAERRCIAVMTLLTASCATLTIVWCASMADMAAMPMPGGWTMSMVWMRMPGQSWTSATTSFAGMWLVMMVAMMMPSMAPLLLRHRRAVVAAGGTRPDRLTLLVGAGYFLVWTVFGLLLHPLGVALASSMMYSGMLARAVPISSGVIVLVAGALQFTAWKARHLACCRSVRWDGRRSTTSGGDAWRYGLHLGRACCCCSVGMTAVLLVLGVMNLGAMAVVTAVVTAERLAPDAGRTARTIGVVTIAAGAALIAQAAGVR